MGQGLDKGGEVFISYARSSLAQAMTIEAALRAEGWQVWRDDQLPAHRAYAEVIEERLKACKAVVVVWSAEAAKSHWVYAEAEFARLAGSLVQLRLDGASLPLPFNQIHCADLTRWDGDTHAPGWRKVVASIRELLGGAAAQIAPAPTHPPLPRKPSLAVLPFTNLSREADQDYFVEGMLDEIVTALTRIRSIFVIASGSSLSLKDASFSVGEAAQRLGVRYVLEGSMRRSGSRVRIAVSLTDAREGARIWAERFEDTLEDVFALQDHIALTVAGVIEPTLQAVEARRVARRPIESLDAYDLYLRAASLRATMRRVEVEEALGLLNSALVLEPNFAPALAQAAGCHTQLLLNRWDDHPEEHRRQALELVARAVEFGADDASVLAQAANAALELDRDMNRAEMLIDRATALNPGLAFGWFISGIVHLIKGEPDTAVEHLERAARLDPISHLSDLAQAHIGAGRLLQENFEEAARLIEQSSHRPPRIRVLLAAAYGHLGRHADAAVELAHYEQASSTPAEFMAANMSRSELHTKILVDGLAKARAGGRAAP